MAIHVGIDFGTTNSAIAVAKDGLAPELLRFPTPQGTNASTWRSVLYFESSENNKPNVTGGAMAIGRYLESGGDGRFIQSTKSHLASRLFNKTNILNKNYALEDLIGMYLLKMRNAIELDLGHTAVVGRPVRYWGATDKDDDKRAIERMTKGLNKAGFTEIVYENEPTAAASKYADRLNEEKLVFIADYGGGTSDFCLLKIGGDGATQEILATGGYGIGGDTFDGALVDHLVAPCLGKGSHYGDGFGKLTEIPHVLYTKLRRWHHLAFLKTRENMALLERILNGAVEEKMIEDFLHVIENDLGLPLHRSIEGIKQHLTSNQSGNFHFLDHPIDISAGVTQDEFSSWVSPDLDKLDAVINEMLQKAGVPSETVDQVFATGGSSLVPAVKNRLKRRFPGRLEGGDELTSVALGLAKRARVEFEK